MCMGQHLIPYDYVICMFYSVTGYGYTPAINALTLPYM